MIVDGLFSSFWLLTVSTVTQFTTHCWLVLKKTQLNKNACGNRQAFSAANLKQH